MEMHMDAVTPGERVILVDDLIATGGTAAGAVQLLKQIGADVVAACFVVDLPDLGGAQKIRNLGVPVRTLVAFEDIEPRRPRGATDAHHLRRQGTRRATQPLPAPCSGKRGRGCP